jgi:hypothetical protein
MHAAQLQIERETKFKSVQTAVSPEEEEIWRLAVPVARDIAYGLLRRKGLHVNKALVEAWSKNRRVIEMARRRVRDERDALRNLKFDL